MQFVQILMNAVATHAKMAVHVWMKSTGFRAHAQLDLLDHSVTLVGDSESIYLKMLN